MSEPPGRILLTGACGYLASRIIQRLESMAEVDYILATDIRPPRVEFSTEKTEFHTLDVCEPFPDLLKEHDVESVVHLAYVMNPGHDRDAAWRVNVLGTENLLGACRNANVKQICYLSSTSVYGAHPDNPEFLTEESPARPIKGFQYSEDKAEVETLLSQYAESQPNAAVTVLRVCPVLGPNADNFIAAAFSKPFLVAVRGYDPPMQFIHEDDLVDNLLRCLIEQPRGTFNLAGEGVIRWSDMARIFGRRLLNVPAPILYGLTGLGWTLRLQQDSPPCGIDFIRHRWTASTRKAQRELGSSFRYSSREAWESFATGGIAQTTGHAD
ncbi:MAG: NAD-dependent epimerase/dehydratase family protein [SAR202 cluster bacterium]|nr:NAD-dependent epimerase/dehydratase family protein [SAR202 cluster bacterium]MDP6513327.1 NAD-dependent epimerase/dehydratase family protein [SAR202 cluster bacterium]